MTGAKTIVDPIFRTQTVVECPGVPAEILIPRDTWPDGESYDQMAGKLAGLFIENFRKFAANVSAGARDAGPQLEGASSALTGD